MKKKFFVLIIVSLFVNCSMIVVSNDIEYNEKIEVKNSLIWLKDIPFKNIIIKIKKFSPESYPIIQKILTKIDWHN